MCFVSVNTDTKVVQLYVNDVSVYGLRVGGWTGTGQRLPGSVGGGFIYCVGCGI